MEVNKKETNKALFKNLQDAFWAFEEFEENKSDEIEYLFCKVAFRFW